MKPSPRGLLPWILLCLVAAGTATALLASAPAMTTEAAAAETAAVTTTPAAVPSGQTCIDCHGDPQLRVTHKKLYDYFQSWRLSTHANAGVGCADCHGGDPTAPDMETAHGASGDIQSAVDFRHVPETCGRCHGDMYDAYVTSRHFALLVEGDQAGGGPNCVTCHGSLDAMALTTHTVDAVCGHCHTEDPSIGRRAESMLRDLDVISAYARYVRLRGSPDTIEQSSRTLEPVHRNLVIEWHTFDIDAIERRTDALLDLSRFYRDRVRQERLEAREAAATGSGASVDP